MSFLMQSDIMLHRLLLLLLLLRRVCFLLNNKFALSIFMSAVLSLWYRSQ